MTSAAETRRAQQLGMERDMFGRRLPRATDPGEAKVLAERAHEILWQVVHLIEDGARFAAGDESRDVLVDMSVRFGAITRAWRKELLTFADWAARRKRFEALQLLLPDRYGTFPSEPRYAGPPQPLLS